MVLRYHPALFVGLNPVLLVNLQLKRVLLHRYVNLVTFIMTTHDISPLLLPRPRFAKSLDFPLIPTKSPFWLPKADYIGDH